MIDARAFAAFAPQALPGAREALVRAAAAEGIVDAHALRAEILRRRDRLRAPQPLPSDASDRHVKLLEEIRDRLDDIAGLLRKRADSAS